MVDTKQSDVRDRSEVGTIPDKIIEFFTELKTNVQRDIDSVEEWKDKMRIAHNMRQGIKRRTDFPYPDAPDIPLPETDKVIRKHKPRFVLAVVSGKKLLEVKAKEGVQVVTDQLIESSRKATMAINHLFRDPDMAWLQKLTLSVDRFLEKGFCLFKIIENFDSRQVNRVVDVENDFDEQTITTFKSLPIAQKKEELSNRYGLDPENEQDKKTLDRIISEFSAGKKVIKFSTEEVTSMADVTTPMPEKVYVPKGTTDISDAERITNEFYWSKRKLTEMALNDILIKDRVLKVLEDKDCGVKMGDDDENEKVKDRLEGIDDSELNSELYKLHETITWYQPKKDGPFERWIFLYFADLDSPHDAIIQWMPYPFEFKGWNYVKHNNEVLDDRYRSPRGVPEQIRAIQEFMERSMNNMLIRDEINNAPMFTVKRTANIVSDTVRFIPGQRINVNDHTDVSQLTQASNVDVSSERIIQTLKAFAEEYVGISDQLFRNATNKGGGKTLGEIQIGVTEAQFTINLDILNWIESIRKVYTQVFYILAERLTKPMVINGTVITREDFQFIPEISVNGSLEMADKALQAQRSQLRLERSRQGVQDGVATQEDLFRAYEDYFEKDGVKEPLDYITDPKEVAQAQITQMQNQIMQLQQILADSQSEIAQADNTLRQIQQQTVRKSGGNGGVNGRAN